MRYPIVETKICGVIIYCPRTFEGPNLRYPAADALREMLSKII